MDPQELGFTPRGPVPWLSPGQLAGTALRVVLSEWFGAYLDKRELQQALPTVIYDEGTGRSELWFDYVADLGDGFDPTYTMAYLLAQPEVTVEGRTLPRGQLLVMGGDEVYPTPSNQQYEDRTKGPYKAALPVPPRGAPQPSVYALPGNHDWYDGLTAFLRLFARNGKDRVGGWRAAQARSYFAIQLPHRWWLFAVDTQFGSYIDTPQLEYFHEVARLVYPGDKVILCPPTPGWVEAVEEAGAYDAIDYFVRTVIEPTGADLRLMLSGDLHHYAHYEGPDRHLVTCGGGGAYLYGTHRLPDPIPVPPPQSLSRKAAPGKDYRLAAAFPTKTDSAGYAFGVFTRLLARNPSFAFFQGIIHTLFMLAVVDVIGRPSGTIQHLVSVVVAIMAILILTGAALFAMPKTVTRRRTKHWLFGLGHGIAHIGLGIGGAYAWAHLPFVHWAWPLPPITAAVLYLPVSGIVASELVALYLLIASNAGVNFNELFAAQSIVDSKSFLRIHIDGTGALTVYPIGVDRVCREWTVRPDDPMDQPWLQPAQPIPTKLVDAPFTV
ncbi:MAG: metallophosphoesterase [Actinobacteria bacterium 13_1_20CM_3_71_11]|nr:MAG: metallophosphoesterase [Actinobacteria bacterium 13_1_20CM_3_71_11]